MIWCDMSRMKQQMTERRRDVKVRERLREAKREEMEKVWGVCVYVCV